MVDATVSFAIGKLDDFLTHGINTRRGVKDGIRWLKDELAYLQSSVRDAEAKQELSYLIRQWIENIKEVANDAVILLERFSALQEEHSDQEAGVLDRMRSLICMCKKESNFYSIGKEIQSLKGRVIEIKNRRDEYGLNNVLGTPIVQQRKRTLLRATSFGNLVDVVGLEDDFKTLLAQLLSEDSSLNLISIYGMGGLGKTTLASKLYHSSELSHFQSRAWVCVSQEYDIKDVLNKIIKSFQGQEFDMLKMDEVDLLRHLRKILQDSNRYLAVIDDIWDVEAWEKIKIAFPDKKNGSRVIVTTRNKKVAERVDDRCFVHELRFMREDESWQLFCKRAKPTRDLEKLGMEMVNRCQGLPLAIVVLSGILLHKTSREDWSKVKDYIWRQLKNDSVEIQDILNLSYSDLSFQMQQCFLYLARFPEDHVIQVNKLKLLWIAEEFITEAEEGDGIAMEDVAEDYLNELVNRSIIQITTLSFNGEVLQCRVHDLVHDLSIQKAAEQKLLGIFDSSKQHTSSIDVLHRQPRHAIYNGIREYLKLLGPSTDNLKLRSLALINQSSRILNIEEMKMIYTRFKYVRVLDLTNVKSEGIPAEIGNLVLLKFLGLTRGSTYKKVLVIPPTIGKLKKLQTLCGSRWIPCEYEFPREIRELKELRHLHFSQGLLRWRLNIGKHQTKIQTLRTIGYEDWIQIDSTNLPNLHTLGIRVDSAEGNAYSLDSVANLGSLQIFILEFRSNILPTIKPLSLCKRLKKVYLYGKIRVTLELLFLPDSVTNLSLHSTEFTEDPMPTLGSISNLTVLELYGVYMGKKMVCGHDAFPSLQFLKVKDLPNLEEWQVDDGAMPSLKGFQIEACEKLKMIPSRITCVPPIPVTYAYKIVSAVKETRQR
ncbi:hypothetical protein DCAR_0416098 [Daucus carota subsp. sativus]|uniref:NB-ARC domain-containing protein n=1 Tax=Daucus carota subsp. sativus TaxID=79200 RepID=A0AAF0WVW0_DAUCS|nr:PREDICTED: disease resistance protein RPP13-like [Daucus carota subsp. sativus]WOG96762.1 hypothetical protein DCAR_0416098 [Daucus carota subsp. sativus]